MKYLKKVETIRKIITVFFCSALFVGCSGQEKTNQDDLVTATPVFTIQPSSTFTTENPTITLSLTPSPTSTRISTPTSDFQNVKQTIFTPASPVICPPSNTSEIAISTEFPLDDHEFESAMIKILNSGGVEQLVRLLSDDNDANFRYEDLTNDGVRELIIRNWVVVKTK